MESKNPAGRFAAQLIVSLCGASLVLLAAAASQSWFFSHVVVPSWYLPPRTLHKYYLARAATALLGFVLLGVIGPWVGRWAGAQRWKELGGSCARIAIALLLALVASEMVVRHWVVGTPIGRTRKLEMRADPRLGWVFVPSRNTVTELAATRRVVHYRIDPWGNRSRSELSTTDPTLPSLVVSGESVALGYGLEYEQTFAAILGERLGLQVVNVAGSAYGSDQAYLRLLDTLERLERPLASLAVFLPEQLRRSLYDNRPRLVLRDGTLALEAAAAGFSSRCRLRNLFVNELPILSEAGLSRAKAVNAAIVLASAKAARARGAEPLFLVPSVGPKRAAGVDAEASIIRELFEKQGLPYLRFDIDPARILTDEFHPDAVAARQIADAVERVLRPRLTR